jgi:hypothetical protein
MNYKPEKLIRTSYPIRLPNNKIFNFPSADKRSTFLLLFSMSRKFDPETIQDLIEKALKS